MLCAPILSNRVRSLAYCRVCCSQGSPAATSSDGTCQQHVTPTSVDLLGTYLAWLQDSQGMLLQDTNANIEERLLQSYPSYPNTFGQRGFIGCSDKPNCSDNPSKTFTAISIQSNVTYPTTSGPSPCWITEYVG